MLGYASLTQPTITTITTITGINKFMTDSNNIDHHFLTEASDLLQNIETTLIALLEEKTVERVHSLMRSAHTLKGSAAHLGLETIEAIAHELETIFECLYPEELEIDPELSALLLDAYECLRTPLAAVLSNSSYDEEAIKNRSESVFSQLKTKLGDYYENPSPPPTSQELGFDLLSSIINDSLPQDLENIQSAIEAENAEKAEELCRGEAEFLLELAKSYQLPGLENIAGSTLKALELHPDRALDIAKIALENFQIAKETILEGDRTTGGNVTAKLAQWTQKTEENALVKTENRSETPPTPIEIYEPYFPPETVYNSGDSIEQILASIASGNPQQNFKQSEETTSPASPPPKPQKTEAEEINIRVALKRLNHLNYAISELAIAQNQQGLKNDRAHKISRQSRRQLNQIKEQLDSIRDQIDLDSRKRTDRKRKAKTSFQNEFDELEMETYSNLHLMLQNLGEKLSHLENNLQNLDRFIGESRIQIRQEKQLLSTAQDELLQARMIPLATVLNRIPPLIEQLGKAYNKPVKLDITGKDVLVDKAISEKLYDPLLHLVRNAFAHAIEPPQIREEKGKLPTGNITIAAYREGNRTLVEVSDDGKGIHWDKIRETALKKQQLISEESDLSTLLFTPGFSTSEEADELSGRGFGLDVVKNQIHALEGTVNLKSQRDRGTTFTLQLPLNLTTGRLLICEAAGRFYSLLAEKVHRMLLPKPEQVENQFLQWEEKGKKQLLPIIPFREVVKQNDHLNTHQKNIPLTPFPLEKRDTIEPLLLIQSQNQPLCLQVDRILIEQELVIKTLPTGPKLPDYIQGYTVLADGSLSLVIDPEAIITENIQQKPPRRTEIKELSVATPTNLPPARSNLQPKSTILVIEDSLVQRRSIVETLETAGYPVLQAGEGKSAIALLQKHPEIDLILCDIEMPQMNGFEFLGYCRQNEQLSAIPVIMLTSRNGDKHRNLALKLGAKSYLTKPCNDRTLLETIATHSKQPPLID